MLKDPDIVIASKQTIYQYAVKVVQGKVGEDFRPIGTGIYATSVNVHNPSSQEVGYSVKLAISGHNASVNGPRTTPTRTQHGYRVRRSQLQ
jgi:hypothetical protein